jgi:hypothetical protein
MEYAAPDRGKGWAFIARMRNGKGDRFIYKYHVDTVDDTRIDLERDIYQQDTYVFRPRGLDPAKMYWVTFDSLETSVLINGLDLLRHGIPLRLENAGMSELLLFEAQET